MIEKICPCRVLCFKRNYKCVDFDKSILDLDEDDGSIDGFDKLILQDDILKETKLKVFRIKEYLPLILVTDEIKDEFLKNNITGVNLTNPNQLVLLKETYSSYYEKL